MHALRVPPNRPGRRVEVALTFPAQPTTRGAVFFSPAPLLGGDLDNNVLRACATALAAAGWTVLRFNYRSVGASEPVTPGVSRYEYWSGVAERGEHGAVLEDAAEAVGRARDFFEPTLFLGYSFGAYVASRTAGAEARLVLIAPPLEKLDFGAVRGRQAQFILAGADELSPPPPVEEVTARFPGATVRVLAGAEHFFRGREADVARAALEEIR